MLIEFTVESLGFSVWKSQTTSKITYLLSISHSHPPQIHTLIFSALSIRIYGDVAVTAVQTDTLLYNASTFCQWLFFHFILNSRDRCKWCARLRDSLPLCQCLLYLICLKLQKPARENGRKSELEDFVAICLTDYRFKVVEREGVFSYRWHAVNEIHTRMPLMQQLTIWW